MSWDWDQLKKEQQAKRNINMKEKKTREVPEWVWGASYILVAIILIILVWFPARWLHYKFGYENKVQQQIIEMVNPEALKEEYRK